MAASPELGGAAALRNSSASCHSSVCGGDKKDARKPTVISYSKLGMDGFTDVKYNTAADEFLENLETAIDALDSAAVEDVACSGGVLTLETTSRGTFILNKQAPNVQMWLSSPISGPHHYDMMTVKTPAAAEEAGEVAAEHVKWESDHDGHDLKALLEKELSDVFGRHFTF